MTLMKRVEVPCLQAIVILVINIAWSLEIKACTDMWSFTWPSSMVAHAEAESFWLFHLLMAHFRDHFVRSLDRDRVSGIGSTIARMNLRLRQIDEELWWQLNDKGIAPEYYSFRWLTV